MNDVKWDNIANILYFEPSCQIMLADEKRTPKMDSIVERIYTSAVTITNKAFEGKFPFMVYLHQWPRINRRHVQVMIATAFDKYYRKNNLSDDSEEVVKYTHLIEDMAAYYGSLIKMAMDKDIIAKIAEIEDIYKGMQVGFIDIVNSKFDIYTSPGIYAGYIDTNSFDNGLYLSFEEKGVNIDMTAEKHKQLYNKLCDNLENKMAQQMIYDKLHHICYRNYEINKKIYENGDFVVYTYNPKDPTQRVELFRCPPEMTTSELLEFYDKMDHNYLNKIAEENKMPIAVFSQDPSSYLQTKHRDGEKGTDSYLVYVA